VLLAAVVAVAGTACADAAPTQDAACVDVGEVRACYAGGAVTWSARPEASRRGGPFACTAGGSCEQRHPALPDDGEWECVELHGAVICHGGEAAAGVIAGPPGPGWTCGGPVAQRGRICVDYAPDRPDRGRWTCRFDQRRGVRRSCVAVAVGREPPILGGACDPGGCPPGAICARGRCVPPAAPSPACWFDADCEEGSACVLAACVPRS
jgi:hypothetical protein